MVEATLRQITLAEQLGFDNAWLSTSIHIPRVDPIACLVAAAARTRSIGLGTAVIIAAHYTLVGIRASVATLSQLAPGRLAIGVGQGWDPRDFPQGLAHQTRAEILRDMVLALSSDTAHSGYHVPILAGGYARRAIARLAQLPIDGWIAGPFLDGPGVRAHGQSLAEASGKKVEMLVMRDTWVTSAGPATDIWRYADATYAEYAGAVPGFRDAQAPRLSVGDRLLFGRGDEVLSWLREMQADFGPSEIIVRIRPYGMPLEMACGGMQRFAEEVMQPFRQSSLNRPGDAT
jgi:alkanesulfonate monooxygenase SsuD/methylene tetrahydromethanopterin reductase-like flavin-dependent oxidoreductase (luciferase family)